MTVASMRIVFVSGVSVGGAPRSTIALAELLRERGHDVTVVLGDRGRAPGIFDLGLRAAIKRRGRLGARPIRSVLRRMGRARRALDARRPWVVEAALSENAYLEIVDREPVDVVVANSFPREQMRWIHDDLERRDVPLCIYVREGHAVTHFSVSGLRPRLTVANSESHAERIRPFTPCVMIPSVIDVTAASVTSDRTTVLLVNPVPENRLDLVLGTAELCPHIPFVLQESWPLSADDRLALEQQIADLPNVELRARTASPAAVYRDARVLLATYPTSRPRVIPEAQRNGIPVIALAYPGLIEATGPGGVVLPVETEPQEMADVISRLWTDDDHYHDLIAACREFSTRAEIDPQVVVERFETALREIVGPERHSTPR